MYIYIDTHTYMYICVCINVHAYTYVYLYVILSLSLSLSLSLTHTHAHTHMNSRTWLGVPATTRSKSQVAARATAMPSFNTKLPAHSHFSVWEQLLYRDMQRF